MVVSFKAMKYILNKMKNKKNRSATFVCSLSFKLPKKKPINAIGKIKGSISYNILGKNGFGYDPIFIPDNYNKTFGEMQKSKKIKIDHRFIAFKNLKKKLKLCKFIFICFVDIKFLNNFLICKAKSSYLAFDFTFKRKVVYRVNFSISSPCIIN